MIIPRTVFPVSTASSKDEMRFNINGVHLERDKDGKPHAVATDGHRLIAVTWKEETQGNAPLIDGHETSEAPDFKTIVPKDAWVKAGRSIPGSRAAKNMPILGNVFVDEKKSNGTVPMATTDIDTANKFEPKSIAGDFPDWRQVVPKYKADEAVTVHVNATYLAEIAKALGDIGNDGKCKKVKLTVPKGDGQRPILLESESDDGVKATAVIMPLRP